MDFWLKVAHIACMTLWFTGLFFLPRLFVARHRRERGGDPENLDPVVNRLFFRIASPAGICAIALGMALMPLTEPGAWLVAKLAVVTLAVLLHLYLGIHLHALGKGGRRHPAAIYHLLGWIPLALLLAAAALSGAKPQPTSSAEVASTSAGTAAAHASGALRSSLSPRRRWP